MKIAQSKKTVDYIRTKLWQAI